MTKNQRYLAIGAAVLALLTTTAVASSYITRESMAPIAEKKAIAAPAHKAKGSQQRVAQAKPACDDHNIVGTVGGAVAGGLVGSQFGKGGGRGLATAGGVVAGGALGNSFIPTHGATCD